MRQKTQLEAEIESVKQSVQTYTGDLGAQKEEVERQAKRQEVLLARYQELKAGRRSWGETVSEERGELERRNGEYKEWMAA